MLYTGNIVHQLYLNEKKYILKSTKQPVTLADCKEPLVPPSGILLLLHQLATLPMALDTLLNDPEAGSYISCIIASIVITKIPMPGHIIGIKPESLR